MMLACRQQSRISHSKSATSRGKNLPKNLHACRRLKQRARYRKRSRSRLKGVHSIDIPRYWPKATYTANRENPTMRTYPGDTRSPHLDPLTIHRRSQKALAPHPKLICTPKRASSTLSPQNISELSQVVSSFLSPLDHGSMQTHPALPIFTYVASEKRPSWTSASNQSFRSPAKEPENCVSGSMLCCLFGVGVSVCNSGHSDYAIRHDVRNRPRLHHGPRCLLVDNCSRKDLPPSCRCRYLLPRRLSMKYRRGSRSLPPDRRPSQWEVVRLPTRATA